MLAHIRDIVEATELPVNADFEGGYAHDPAGVAQSVRLCVETGVAGLSIEDSNRRTRQSRFMISMMPSRACAHARAAIDGAGGDVVLTGRCEGFLVGAARPRRGGRALKAIRGGRRRLRLCAGHPHARADRGGGRGGGAPSR